MEEIMSLLFETNAFKISNPDHPFWATSGKLTPYYINTHFLYGSQADAEALLDYINEQLESEERVKIPQNVFKKVFEQYTTNRIYKTITDLLIEYLKSHIDIDEVDYISGGERRDWYFSMMVAYLLKKPHITIYKDVTAIESSYDFETNSQQANFDNKNILHVADLLTVASSFVRAWIPAVKDLGGNLKWALVVVDRNQGGPEVLAEHDVKALSLFKIDEHFFDKALELGKINQTQLELLKAYTANPDETMKQFLIDHPTFIEDTLNGSDEKAAKRAKLLIEGNLYGLN